MNNPFQYSDPDPKVEPAQIENLEMAAPTPPQRATFESDSSEDDADDERNNSGEDIPALEERPETPVRDQREEERNHGGEAKYPLQKAANPLQLPQPPKRTDLGESRGKIVKSTTDGVPPR